MISKFLFRENFRRKSRGGFYGEVFFPKPAGYGVYTLISAGIMFFLIFIVYFIPIKKVVSIKGRILPVDGYAEVSVRNSGTLANWYADPGGKVEAGDLILQVWKGGDSSYSKEEMTLADEEIRLVERQSQNVRDLHQIKVDNLKMQIEQLQNEVSSVSNVRAIQGSIVESLGNDLEKMSSLLKNGLVSRIKYEDLRREYLSESKELAIVRNRLSEIKAVLRSEDSRVRELKKDRDRKLILLEKERKKLIRDSKKIVDRYLSPRSGYLAINNLGVGSVVSEGEYLFSIVSEDDKLTVEFVLPSEVRSQVSLGSEVFMEIGGFPKERYGTVNIKIESISAAVVSPDKYVGHLELEKPSFVAKATISRKVNLSSLGSLMLVPGISVGGYLVVSESTIFDSLVRGNSFD
ncbi:HlyD family secretion protein [Microbulbifer sediminum]|uniref:HlyD family secretion protein n=1 Tax=Microbulbifer sediminum TaxID=2904250 RepID=UPI001F216A45|nr:HlyD family efflux transporter periplasmic adaptor subunit [Microbulbifer sediminum]